MIRILNEKDDVEAKKLVNQIHELHVKNRNDYFTKIKNFFQLNTLNK